MNGYKPRASGSAYAATMDFIEQCGGVEPIHRHKGARQATIYGWTDPDKSTGIPYSHVAELTEHFGATALAEDLAARAGGFFIPASPQDGAQWPDITADLAIASGAAVARVVQAMGATSDGGVSVTPREARELLPEIDKLQRLLAHLRAQALDTARGGG